MPIVIGTDRVIVDLDGQRGDGLVQAVTPKAIAESSEKQGGCFTRYPGDRKHDSGNQRTKGTPKDDS